MRHTKGRTEVALLTGFNRKQGWQRTSVTLLQTARRLWFGLTRFSGSRQPGRLSAVDEKKRDLNCGGDTPHRPPATRGRPFPLRDVEVDALLRLDPNDERDDAALAGRELLRA